MQTLHDLAVPFTDLQASSPGCPWPGERRASNPDDISCEPAANPPLRPGVVSLERWLDLSA